MPPKCEASSATTTCRRAALNLRPALRALHPQALRLLRPPALRLLKPGPQARRPLHIQALRLLKPAPQAWPLLAPLATPLICGAGREFHLRAAATMIADDRTNPTPTCVHTFHSIHSGETELFTIDFGALAVGESLDFSACFDPNECYYGIK
jgi:hypothetical protein